MGLRPFLFQLARQFGQNGWVANTAAGLTLVIEGEAENQKQMLERFKTDLPPQVYIASMSVNSLPLANFPNFRIITSSEEGDVSPFVQPDRATCTGCRRDIFDSQSRFYRYPFTSCSGCGPRYSIMHSQPYDRQRTTMAAFTLCPACESDYRSSGNRRFHAQTIACAACGPRLSLTDAAGKVLAVEGEALRRTAGYLGDGNIIAVKGIGGFQLWVDAANHSAIERLRSKKHRPSKPLAIMAAELPMAEGLCFVSAMERQALTSPAAPIVLMSRKFDAAIAENVAPDTDLLGVMLAYAPLHHLLLADFGAPVVATSGNRQDEPICIDNDQALKQLNGLADYFLTHDRMILRSLDDSIVREIAGALTVLRRARGYAPLPVTVKTALPDALAVGGHLKNTVAISRGRHLIIGPHIGNLDSEPSRRQMAATCSDLLDFYRVSPHTLVRDGHDGYASSQYAERQFRQAGSTSSMKKIQHHYAHVLACMAEHDLEPPLLGVAWDGNGLGDDGSLWGGEFFILGEKDFTRFAHLRPFFLPGGVNAIREPRRAALGVLAAMPPADGFMPGKLSFSETEWSLLQTALSKRINSPRTTSIGRLFDAVASLTGICQINQYEGQAAMMLENCAAKSNDSDTYPFTLVEGEPWVVDWQPLMEQLLTSLESDNPENVAKKFHNTLANVIVSVAEKASLPTVVLSGGCFQNALLTESAMKRLSDAGFKVYCPRQIPPNDGGLALGQLYAVQFIE